MKIKIFLLTLLLSYLTVISSFAQFSPGQLSKGHANLEGVENCTKCHSVGNKVLRDKCLECHKEIKASIASKKGFHASVEVGTKNCLVCHNEHHGRDFQLIKINKKSFNHTDMGFELKGVHAKKDCRACHKAEFVSDPNFKKKTSTYMGLSSACLNCHSDFHQGKLSANCASCHNFNSFKNPKVVGFDHNKTKFAILGKHKNVSCLKCHKTEIINAKPAQRFKGLQFESCTPCHKDKHENKFGSNCKECHSEESFHAIKNISSFNHDKTGFQLVGKHKTVACKLCHKTESMTDPLKHDKCSSCHADYHKGEFAKKGVSPDCNDCHTNKSFAETNFTIERHSKLKFKLEGAHMATTCMECHRKQKDWKFAKMPVNCVECHKNIHKGFINDKFMPSENCTLCHTVTSWKSVTFDHEKTGFKLEGTHAKQVCASCHFKKNSIGVRVQQFEGISKECSSCHKDNHVGQFAENSKTECLKCHGFTTWKDSKFVHTSSRFKLEGAHRDVKCIECHKQTIDQKGTYIKYKFKSIDCNSCHS